MREERYFYVYLLTSSSRRVLYTGVTNNLIRRLQEHRAGECEFTAKYKAFRLVHVESFLDIRNAIQREKTIKGWTRARKNELVFEQNPQWRDLAVSLNLACWPEQSEPQGPSLRSG